MVGSLEGPAQRPPNQDIKNRGGRDGLQLDPALWTFLPREQTLAEGCHLPLRTVQARGFLVPMHILTSDVLTSTD